MKLSPRGDYIVFKNGEQIGIDTVLFVAFLFSLVLWTILA
jgi:hypothetical protein